MSPDVGTGPEPAAGVGSSAAGPGADRDRAGGATAAGLLLVSGEAARARDWVLDGLSPAVVAPQDGGWTAIVPHGARSWAAAPFDDAVVALLGRRVKRRLLPAIGVALVGRRLVLCVIPAVLRPRRSWLVWEPGVGLVRPGTLTPGTVGQLAAVADHREQRDVAARMLADGRGSAERVLRDLWDTLGLPGADLATGVLAAVHAPGAVLVEPSREDVARFNRTVHEVRRWREEVEGDR